MLYERWRAISKRHRDQVALRSLAEARTWTFGELAAHVEALPESIAQPVFPKGQRSDFIIETLRAWRDRRLLCPLDEGQQRPRLSDLPPESRHVKATSGTTGATRLILFTESQLAADADNIVETMGLSPDSPNLGVISLAHSYGFSNLVLPLMLHGVPLVLAASPLPETVRVALSTGDNWTLPAVPALWRTWRDAGIIPDNLRLAISAGSPLPLDLEQGIFRERGLKIHNFLGSSECGGVAYDRSDVPRQDGSDVGTPLENVCVTTTADGRLRVSGPAVGASYWPEPDPSLKDGVFELGDLADIHDGAIRLQGRADDRINVAGRKVSPESIERVLLSHASVSSCLVFGVPSLSPERSDDIVAVVAGDESRLRDKLRRHLDAELPAWQIPRHWSFVPSLDANARGKLSRADWRRRFLESRDNDPS